MADPVDSRKEQIEWLKDMQTHYATYHNHKENLAWAAVALYVALASLLAAAMGEEAVKGTLPLTQRAAATFIVVGAGVLAWMHMQLQLYYRGVGAEYVAAISALRSEMVADPSFKTEMWQWLPGSAPREGDPSPKMPSKRVTPLIVETYVDRYKATALRARVILENSARLLIVVVMVACLSALWFAELRAADQTRTSMAPGQRCPSNP